MPVTARLSRQFYEKLGDEVVNELVALLNTVDSDGATRLRELNEANWHRMEARFAAFDARMGAFDAKLDAKLDRFKAELIKWMFLFWIGTVASLGGLMLALAGR